MAIHVNIGEAKTRLSELVAAAVRGEDVVLNKAGEPQVRLEAVSSAVMTEHKRVAEKRRKAIGMFACEAEGYDLGLEALKQDRPDPNGRYRRKFGAAD